MPQSARFAAVVISLLTAAGALAGLPNFQATQFTGGGGSVVRVVSSINAPVLSGSFVDTGKDQALPLNLNNDGASWDVVTADHDTQLIRIRLQPAGGGSAFTNSDFIADGHPTDLAVRDLNGDGNLDIITVEDGAIKVYIGGTPSGNNLTFIGPITLSASDSNSAPLAFNKIAVDDFDGDGKLDIVGVGTAVVNTFNQIQVAVFKNTTTTSLDFAPAQLYTGPGTGDFVATGNLTRHGADGALDSFPEIVVGSNNGDNASNGSGSGSYTTFLNKGDGTFGSEDDADENARPFRNIFFLHIHALGLCDVDGDGNRDLVLENSNIGQGKQTFLNVYPGGGDGSFGGAITAFIGNNPSALKFQGALAFGDFNLDGNVDIAVTDPVNTSGILVFACDPSEGAGQIFQAAGSSKYAIATGAEAKALGVTKNNSDTKLDLVIANGSSAPFTLLTNNTGGGGGTTGGSLAKPAAPIVSAKLLQEGGAATITTTDAPFVTGLTITFQYQPVGDTDWTDLDVAKRSGNKYSLVTKAIPSGDLTFRAVASAPNHEDAISESSESYHVLAGGELPQPVIKSVVAGANLTKPWTITLTDAGPKGLSISVQASPDGGTYSAVPIVRTVAGAGGKYQVTATVPNDAAFFKVTVSKGTDIPATSRVFSLFQPDGTVAPVAQTSPKIKLGSAVGKGILIPGAEIQNDDILRGGTQYYAFTFTNVSRYNDVFRLGGVAGGSGYRINYFAQGGATSAPTIGADITTTMVANNYSVPISAGGVVTVYASIHINAAFGGNNPVIAVTAISGTDPTKSDTASEELKVKEPKNTYFVTTTADSGVGSLRDAITTANAHKGTTVLFDIPLTGNTFIVNGSHHIAKITPATLLPPITAQGTVVDGSSLLEALGETLADPPVAIIGPGATTAFDTSRLFGLDLSGSKITLRGLQVNFFANGVTIAGPKVTGCVIQGCRFVANTTDGLNVSVGAHDNLIGGADAGAGNVFLAFNQPSEDFPVNPIGSTGIHLDGVGVTGNDIQGNVIGRLEGASDNYSYGFLSGINISGGASKNTVGGLSPGMGNLISGNSRPQFFPIGKTGAGVLLAGVGTNANLVVGNKIGTNAAGSDAAANADGIVVTQGARLNIIGGKATSAANVISGNNHNGIDLNLGVNGDSAHPTSDNQIVGNLIGLDATGVRFVSNGSHGILLESGADGTIIGGGEGAGNVISGNLLSGIRFLGAKGVLVQNNFIGPAADGTTAIGNGVDGSGGVEITTDSSNNSIFANLIAFNGGAGVTVGGDGSVGNTIRENQISQNRGLGINLSGGDESSIGHTVTANDPLNHDSDTGPNNLQNFPSIANASSKGAKQVSIGNTTLRSKPNATYVIDFYASDSIDPSGYGEGQRFLGAKTVQTNSAGAGTVTGIFKGAETGHYITATATDVVTGDTSEFSAFVRVDPGSLSADMVADPTSGAAPLEVNFSAADSGGVIVSYGWDFGDGNTGSGITPSHTYATFGTYTATLTVTDSHGATQTATKLISVAPAPPVN